MKNSTNLMLMLLFVSALCLLCSCKKSSDHDDEPTIKNHKVILKVATDTRTFFSTATYTDGSGRTEAFTNTERLSSWSSQELTVAATAKTIQFSATAAALNNNQYFLNVEIWIDGVKSAEEKTMVVSKGLMKATVNFSF